MDRVGCDDCRRKFPVRDCGRVPRLRGRDVTAKTGPGGARFGGFFRCGSIWACPSCSASIRQGRADEISKGAGAWIRQGNSALGARVFRRSRRSGCACAADGGWWRTRSGSFSRTAGGAD